jgi:hypothetical protein
MTDWESRFKSQLLPGEELISVVPDLEHRFEFVPNVGLNPDNNQPAWNEMILGLTNRRLIAKYTDGKISKWFYTSAIHSLTERRISQDQPKWPYQATMIFAGGLGLIVQTSKVDKIQQEQLSSLLVHAFMKFNSHEEDAGAIAAIIAYEEERQRRQRDDTDDKK